MTCEEQFLEKDWEENEENNDRGRVFPQGGRVRGRYEGVFRVWEEIWEGEEAGLIPVLPLAEE